MVKRVVFGAQAQGQGPHPKGKGKNGKPKGKGTKNGAPCSPGQKPEGKKAEAAASGARRGDLLVPILKATLGWPATPLPRFQGVAGHAAREDQCMLRGPSRCPHIRPWRREHR